MPALLSDQFAPITWSIGFLQARLDHVSVELKAWRERLFGVVELRDVGFTDGLQLLDPLTTATQPRELLVEAGQWTAYFDCGLRGTDAEPVIGYLSSKMQCVGLSIASVPDLAGTRDAPEAPLGATEFMLFGPLQTDFLNYVRTVSVVNEGHR